MDSVKHFAAAICLCVVYVCSGFGATSTYDRFVGNHAKFGNVSSVTGRFSGNVSAPSFTLNGVPMTDGSNKIDLTTFASYTSGRSEFKQGGSIIVKGPWVDIKAFSAKGDVKTYSNGAITSGSAVFTSYSGAFTSGDIGKQIAIHDAGLANTTGTGPSNWPLCTTIVGVTNSSTITLASVATATATHSSFMYGTDDTSALQAAINYGAGKITLISAGTYFVNAAVGGTTGLSVPSNSDIRMMPGTVLQVIPNSGTTYSIFYFTGVSNIKIDGGTIIGDRNWHNYNAAGTHEFGHSFKISSSTSNVKISNIISQEFTGDGASISAANGNIYSTYVDGVVFKDCIFDSNRRQGISIGGAKNVQIIGGRITNIGADNSYYTGTDPKYGIDIESGTINKPENILIQGTIFNGNSGGSVVNADGRNVVVDSIVSDNSVTYNVNSNMVISNSTFTNTKNDGVAANGVFGGSTRTGFNASYTYAATTLTVTTTGNHNLSAGQSVSLDLFRMSGASITDDIISRGVYTVDSVTSSTVFTVTLAGLTQTSGKVRVNVSYTYDSGTKTVTATSPVVHGLSAGWPIWMDFLNTSGIPSGTHLFSGQAVVVSVPNVNTFTFQWDDTALPVSGYGVQAYTGNHTTIVGNTFKGFAILVDGDSVTVSGNTIRNASTAGIRGGAHLTNLNITGNTITNSPKGIELSDTSYATVSGNTIIGAQVGGINLLTIAGRDVVVKGNSIYRSVNGITVSQGSANILLENNFIDLTGYEGTSSFAIQTINNTGLTRIIGNTSVGGSSTSNFDIRTKATLIGNRILSFSGTNAINVTTATSDGFKAINNVITMNRSTNGGFGIQVASNTSAIIQGNRIFSENANTINPITTSTSSGSQIVGNTVYGGPIAAAATDSVVDNLVSGYRQSAIAGAVSSGSTITPTGQIFHVTGTTTINTINLPYTGFVGSITIIPDGVFATGTSGNIAIASTSVVSRPLVMTYDATAAKWYPSY